MAKSETEDFDLPEPPPEFDDDVDADEEVGEAWQSFKQLAFNRRTAFFAGFFIVAVIAFFYVLLPLLPGLRDGLRRVQEDADRYWLAAAFLCELGSYAAYIWLFKIVFAERIPRIHWRESYLISMAGVAATRLLGAAGAGGIALNYWAVRRAGMPRRDAISHQVAFLVILYVVFMSVLMLNGLALYLGLVPGNHPFGVTVIPAIFGAIVTVVFLLMLLVPANVERIVGRLSLGEGRVGSVARRLAQAPALLGEGTRVAIRLLRERPAALAAAIGWWGFDIAVLWACFKAFGGTPELAVVIMGYFVGMIANMLPVPGGVGAVEGGMIGTFVAFGVSTGPAVAAVLAYRLFAFFLPTLPGIVAYTALVRTVAEWREEDATIKSKVLPAENPA